MVKNMVYFCPWLTRKQAKIILGRVLDMIIESVCRDGEFIINGVGVLKKEYYFNPILEPRWRYRVGFRPFKALKEALIEHPAQREYHGPGGILLG